MKTTEYPHRIVLLLVLGLFVVLGRGAVAHAQPLLPQYGGLKVQVVDASSKEGIAQAEVCLIGRTPDKSVRTYTNEKGVATFEQTPSSLSQVIAAKIGYVGQREVLTAGKINTIGKVLTPKTCPLGFTKAKVPTICLQPGSGGPRCPKRAGGGSTPGDGNSGSDGGVETIPTEPGTFPITPGTR